MCAVLKESKGERKTMKSQVGDEGAEQIIPEKAHILT